MGNTTELIKEAVDTFVLEDAKFRSGNSAAGTRSRKALGDLNKLVKMRRSEISADKAARKEAKAV